MFGGWAKRIFLFLAVNFLVILTISFILSFFNIQPYLQKTGLNYQSLLIFCTIWGMGGAFISLAISRIVAKWSMGLQMIDPNTNDPSQRQILEMVYGLAQKARLPEMPEVGVYSSPELNAFATGPSKRRSLVAISSGLLQRMDRNEVEGVIGHEISHIANGDMVTMTLLQGIINAFVMFMARVLAYVVSGLGRDRDSESPTMLFYVLTFVFEIVFMFLGSIVIATYSRFREYRADAGGAELAGRMNMIHALQALQKYAKIQDPQAQQTAVQAFKISNPGGLLRLFASHPPLEERIARLEANHR